MKHKRLLTLIMLLSLVIFTQSAGGEHYCFKMKNGTVLRGETTIPEKGFSGEITLDTKAGPIRISASEVQDVLRLPVPRLEEGCYRISVTGGEKYSGRIKIVNGLPEVRFGCLTLLRPPGDVEIPLDKTKKIEKINRNDREVEDILEKENSATQKFRETWNLTVVHKTAHYLILSSATREHAELVGDMLEKLYLAFSKVFGKEMELFTPKNRMPVWLFASQEEFDACRKKVCEGFIPNSGILRGLFDKSTLRFFVHIPQNKDTSRIETLQPYVLHEGTHQLLYVTTRLRGGKDWLWLDEGLATYFGNSAILNGELQLGQYTEGTNLIQTLKTNAAIAFDLVDMMKKENYFKGNITLNYARSWTFVHFLMQNEEYKTKLLLTLKDMRDCMPTKKAFYRHFKKELFDLLKGWKKHATEMK